MYRDTEYMLVMDMDRGKEYMYSIFPILRCTEIRSKEMRSRIRSKEMYRDTGCMLVMDRGKESM